MSHLAMHGQRKVIIALDGSPAAAAALPVARAVAGQLDARVEALYVGKPQVPEEVIRAALRLDDEAYRAIRLRLQEGDPATEILRAAEEAEVLLVILATHGHDIGRGQGLAPIARQVIAGADGPVLLVRPENARPEPLRRLLFPLDGTPTTTAALGPAMELAGRLEAVIDLLYVLYPRQPAAGEHGSIGPPVYVDQPQHEWPAWRARMAEWLRCNCDRVPKDAELRVFLARGLTAGETGAAIARFADEHREDAIVLVRRSRLEAGRGQILRYLLDHAPCPVLLVAGPIRSAAPQRERPLAAALA